MPMPPLLVLLLLRNVDGERKIVDMFLNTCNQISLLITEDETTQYFMAQCNLLCIFVSSGNLIITLIFFCFICRWDLVQACKGPWNRLVTYAFMLHNRE